MIWSKVRITNYAFCKFIRIACPNQFIEYWNFLPGFFLAFETFRVASGTREALLFHYFLCLQDVILYWFRKGSASVWYLPEIAVVSTRSKMGSMSRLSRSQFCPRRSSSPFAKWFQMKFVDSFVNIFSSNLTSEFYSKMDILTFGPPFRQRNNSIRSSFVITSFSMQWYTLIFFHVSWSNFCWCFGIAADCHSNSMWPSSQWSWTS